MGFGQIVSGAVAAAGCALLVCIAPTAAADETAPVGWQRYTPAWRPASVAPGERTVMLAVTEGSCGSRDRHLAVSQRAGSVRVRVSAEHAIWPPGVVLPCPAPRPVLVPVHLERRLAGRPIVGAGEAAAEATLTGSRENGATAEPGTVAPRLIGFSLQDARLAVSEYPIVLRVLRPRSGGSRGGILTQSPGPGGFVPAGGKLLVRLG